MSIKLPRVLALASAVHGLRATPCSAAQEFVIPNAYASAAGNAATTIPLRTTGDVRMQQVCSFAEMGGPKRIIGVSFRYIVSGGFYITTKPIPDFFLSTTTRTPDNLNANFASNRGSDHVMVFARRDQTNFYSSTLGTWGNQIAFDVPFDYNDFNGNLLIETVGSGGSQPSSLTFDAVNVAGDAISRMYATSSASTGALPANITTTGLILKFHYVPYGATYVDISATDSSASETGPDPAVFRVKRTGDTTAALTVSYVLDSPSGSVNAADLQPLSGTVIIPAGSTTADITVTPIDDGLAESSETIQLRIVEAGYSTGLSPTATATLAASAATVERLFAAVSGGNVNLTFAGLVPGTNYTVQRSYNLSAWTALGQRNSTTPTLSEAKPAGQPRVYYRLAK